MRILGGTVLKTEVQMLKKLLFRATRGKAILSTFLLEVKESEKMNKVDFGFDKMVGYIVLFDDTANIGHTIMRVCNTFQADLFETSILNCRNDLI